MRAPRHSHSAPDVRLVAPQLPQRCKRASWCSLGCMERDVGRHSVSCAWEGEFVSAMREIDAPKDKEEPVVVRE